MIDSTIVRAHQHSAGAKKAGRDEAIGHSRDGLSTKIQTTVDALGNPTGSISLAVRRTAHDLVGADHLLPQIKADTLLAPTRRSTPMSACFNRSRRPGKSS
jgi:hypothetical protein